jgi:hypothetical protein
LEQFLTLETVIAKQQNVLEEARSGAGSIPDGVIGFFH